MGMATALPIIVVGSCLLTAGAPRTLIAVLTVATAVIVAHRQFSAAPIQTVHAKEEPTVKLAGKSAHAAYFSVIVSSTNQPMYRWISVDSRNMLYFAPIGITPQQRDFEGIPSLALIEAIQSLNRYDRIELNQAPTLPTSIRWSVRESCLT